MKSALAAGEFRTWNSDNFWTTLAFAFLSGFFEKIGTVNWNIFTITNSVGNE
jgi:hypothetical protein